MPWFILDTEDNVPYYKDISELLTYLSYTNSLLLHGFMYAASVMLPDTIKLIWKQK